MRWIAVAALVAALSSGCAVTDAGQTYHTVEPEYNTGGLAREADPPAVPTRPTQPEANPPGEVREAPLEDAQVRIQRAGVITLDVKDGMKFSLELLKNAGKFDALVMAFGNTEVNYRMPSAKLNALLEWLSSQDPRLVEVDGFDFSALDRTAEYFSLESRIEVARAAYDRARELLKTAANAGELSQLEARLEQLQVKLDGFETTLRDIKLRAGRVEVRIVLK